jgi:hypothetical protein
MAGRNRQPGYVLVMVLIVLAMAGSVLAAATCRTSRRVLDAGESERRLQRKWLAVSAQTVILDRAEEVLAGKADAAGRVSYEPPAVTRHIAITAGGMDFTLVLSDEQAKANVNMMAKRRAETGNLDEAMRVLQASNRTFLPVRLRPSPTRKVRATTVPILYETFDQCLTVEGPWQLVSTEAARGVASQEITCWGGGKINFRRASMAALREVCVGCLDDIQLDTLIRLRNQEPRTKLSEALALLKLTDQTRDEALALLTDESHCHSLWVIAHDKTRDYFRLYIDQYGDPDCETGRYTYAWEP